MSYYYAVKYFKKCHFKLMNSTWANYFQNK